jgi:hypothetical protein
MTTTAPVPTPLPTPSKTKVSEADVLDFLLSLKRVKEAIGSNTLIKKSCVNVYDNKWRINLWTGTDNPIIPNAGRILQSYFVRCCNGSVEILED